jgi:uncharacterized coiled-coil protein SlyX
MTKLEETVATQTLVLQEIKQMLAAPPSGAKVSPE